MGFRAWVTGFVNPPHTNAHVGVPTSWTPILLLVYISMVKKSNPSVVDSYSKLSGPVKA